MIDHFGLFAMDAHPAGGWRILGAALMIGGIALIAKF
jgi:bacterial/archaeal transporter family-2 protein